MTTPAARTPSTTCTSLHADRPLTDAAGRVVPLPRLAPYPPLGAAIRRNRLAWWTRISGCSAGGRRVERAADGGRSAADQARAPGTGRQVGPARGIVYGARREIEQLAASHAGWCDDRSHGVCRQSLAVLAGGIG